MGRQLNVLLILVLAVLLAGCCCDNDVCKGKESYVPAYGRSELVEETCDDCMNVLKISSQDNLCLNTATQYQSSRDLTDDGKVPPEHKFYPFLHGTDDEWSGCESLKDDKIKLKCGCCILLDGEGGSPDITRQYKFERGECYTSASEEALYTRSRWAVVPEKDYFEDMACVG